VNFHFARGLLYDVEFLTEGVGFPVLGALVALAIGASKLPFSLSRQ
jgi:hypothetical protein